MRPFQPMTFLVILALAICILAGLWILWRAARLRSAAPRCTRCKTENRPDARFCACCGASLQPAPGSTEEKDTTHA